MADFNVHAIVLRRMQFGETDNILTLYTRERGRISAIAKGARKPISRLSGATEVLSYTRFALASARTLQVVKQAEVVNSFSPLRQDLSRLANGLYAAELLGALVLDDDSDPDLFELLAATLQLIAEFPTPSRAVRWFELRLLDEVGYAPVLSECTHCRAALLPAPRTPTTLSASQGGLLCARHCNPSGSEDQSRLDQESLKLLQGLDAISSVGEPRLRTLLDRSGPSDRLAAAALRRYIRYRLDRELKSIEFLDTVQEQV